MLTYFLCFFIFSFIGWIIEIIFHYLKTNQFQNRKTMKFLPLCPVYGASITLLFFIKPALKYNKLLYFIAGFVICTTVEYLFNSFVKEKFNLKFWDYSDSKFNLQGNICIEFSVIWALISSVLLHFYDDIMLFFYNFPDVISVAFALYFTVDLFETYYLYKNNEIGYINKFCPVVKKA